MRRISDLGSDSQALLFRRQDIEHGGARDECRGTQGNFEFIRRAIVVSDGLVFATRHRDRVKGGDLGRREVVQGSVDVPPVEAGVTFSRVLCGDLRLVKTGMLGVFQLCFSEAFVVVNGAVSDELNLRNSRDRL